VDVVAGSLENGACSNIMCITFEELSLRQMQPCLKGGEQRTFIRFSPVITSKIPWELKVLRILMSFKCMHLKRVN
jgi:hypothetical protein